MSPPAQPIIHFREGLPTPHLQPDWLASSPSSAFKIACYFANMYRTAPWPKSGGFCVFLNAKADPTSQALMLPDDLILTRPTPRWDEVKDDGSDFKDATNRKWNQVFGVPWSQVIENTYADGNGMRGDLRFKNVSSKDPRLCRAPKSYAEREGMRTVLLTPMGNPLSMKHWAVSVFAAFSLNQHLRRAYGLPRLTHLLSGGWNGTSRNAWVQFMQSSLPPAMGNVHVTPGTALNERQTSSKDRTKRLPAVVPKWSQQCFNGIIVGIGAGHSIDPLWMVDRTDALRLRKALARSLIKMDTEKTSPPPPPPPSQFGAKSFSLPQKPASATAASSHASVFSVSAAGSSSLRRIATESLQQAKQAVRSANPSQLKVLIVNRKKRKLANVPQLIDAIRSDAAAPERRGCASLAGECDLSWKLESIRDTFMEGMRATDQIRTWLDGPNVVVVPHGAGSTHATYLPPCSVVIEVVPNMYPQFSFLVPTLRSGSYMLYLYETSVIGNPQLACINTSIGKTRIARGDPAMHVHPPLLVQLLHRGAALRKRCLANYPSIEYNPHERMQQNGLAFMASGYRGMNIPRMLSPQEAIGYHSIVPIIATGPGVTKALWESSHASRLRLQKCRTSTGHGPTSNPSTTICQAPAVAQSDLLYAYASLRGARGGEAKDQNDGGVRGLVPDAAATACVEACNLELLELESPSHEHVHKSSQARGCKACLHQEVAAEVSHHHQAPAADEARAREIRKRTTCAPRAHKSSPMTTAEGYRAYMAALVNRTCGLSSASVLPNGELDDTKLPYMFKARIKALCQGRLKGLQGLRRAGPKDGGKAKTKGGGKAKLKSGGKAKLKGGGGAREQRANSKRIHGI